MPLTRRLGTASGVDESMLTFNNNGVPIRKGLVEKELDYHRRFLYDRLGSISVQESEDENSSLTLNFSFNLFEVVNADVSSALAFSILATILDLPWCFLP